MPVSSFFLDSRHGHEHVGLFSKNYIDTNNIRVEMSKFRSYPQLNCLDMDYKYGYTNLILNVCEYVA
jgi:hypothetical protein